MLNLCFQNSLAAVVFKTTIAHLVTGISNDDRIPL